MPQRQADHKGTANNDTVDASGTDYPVTAESISKSSKVNNNNNGDVDVDVNVEISRNGNGKGIKKLREKKDGSSVKQKLPENDIETQLEHQIHSQLQDQLQNEMDPSLEQVQSVEGINHSKVNAIDDTRETNMLDATNIDDELKNLENIDMDSIAKTTVDEAAAAVVSYARAAADVGIDLDVEADHSNENATETDGADEKVTKQKRNDGVRDDMMHLNHDDEINDVDVGVDVDVDDGEVDAAVMADIVKRATIGHLKANGSTIGDTDNDDDIDMTIVNTKGNKKRSADIVKERDIGHLLRGKKFLLPLESSENENVKNIIESCGGSVVSIDDADVTVLVPSKDEALDEVAEQYPYRYIYDIYTKRALPSLKRYKITGKSKTGQELDINIGDFPAHKNVILPHNAGEQGNISLGMDSLDGLAADEKAARPKTISIPKRRSKKFTPEEDEYILDLVRRNPHLRSTHTFFARISELKPLSEHTGNSIRYRYRKVLAPNLEYVYKLDPRTGKPDIDTETGLPIQIREIPSLIKSQYTPEEDYLLCQHIWAYKSGDFVVSGARKSEVAQIPEAVFEELHKKNPRHSTMSWRDRYRKFAAKYGLKNYMTYYEDCQEKNIPAEPMKNMSSRANRKDYKVDVFENEKNSRKPDSELEGTAKRLKLNADTAKVVKANILFKPDVSNGVDLVDKNADNIVERSHKDANNSDMSDATVDPILAATQAVAGSAIKAMSNISEHGPKEGDSGEEIAESGSLETLNDATSEKTEESESKSVGAIPEKASVGLDEDTNLFASATVAEMKQYDISLADSNKKDSNDDSSIKLSGVDATRGAEHDEAEASVELVNIKADDGLMDFRQLIDIDPEPLKNRHDINLESMVRNIHTCFRNFGDNSTPYELFKDISDQTGISMLWLNYWFDCSCGMLGTFIQAIIHYLETGELILNNVSGFWTEKDDELLRLEPENEELLKLHGKDSVTKRKAVLFSYVV
jgi:hypothetical protein